MLLEKRLGVKISGGLLSKASRSIIVRQRGRAACSGTIVGMGKDFTLFALFTELLIKNILKTKSS